MVKKVEDKGANQWKAVCNVLVGLAQERGESEEDVRGLVAMLRPENPPWEQRTAQGEVDERARALAEQEFRSLEDEVLNPPPPQALSGDESKALMQREISKLKTENSLPAPGTLERKIYNTCERWFKNREEWPKLQVLVNESNGAAVDVIATIDSSQHLRFLDHHVRPITADRRVMIVYGQEPAQPEPKPVAPQDPEPAEPEPTKLHEPKGDGEKLDVHEAALEDMRRFLEGRDPLTIDRWREPNKHWSKWSPEWPGAIRGGRSNNIPMMMLACKLADAIQRRHWITVEYCVNAVVTMVEAEQAGGYDLEELWGEYTSWNRCADLALIRFVRDAGFFEIASNLEDQYRNHVAVWRCMLPGDGGIEVRNERGKVIYDGWGCRTAGGRKLPKSMVELSFGVVDLLFGESVGAPESMFRGRNSTEFAIFKALKKHNAIPRFPELRDLATAQQSLQDYRTSVPYVIERHANGDVVTYVENAPSSQTGSVYCVWQSADGRRFEYLFPYPKARVRKDWGPIKNGHGTRSVGSYKANNGVEATIYEMQIGGTHTIDWRARFTRNAAPNFELPR